MAAAGQPPPLAAEAWLPGFLASQEDEGRDDGGTWGQQALSQPGSTPKELEVWAFCPCWPHGYKPPAVITPGPQMCLHAGMSCLPHSTAQVLTHSPPGKPQTWTSQLRSGPQAPLAPTHLEPTGLPSRAYNCRADSSWPRGGHG